MTYEPDFGLFAREVHRRASLGESTEQLAKEFGVPLSVVVDANALGDSSLLEPTVNGAYPHRLYALARRRPGLFFATGFAPDVPVKFADSSSVSTQDTDDIEDPFGPVSRGDGYLGGIV